MIHKCTNFGIACRAHHKLFVKGLPQDITEEKLHIQCKEAGRVSDIRLFPDESKTNAYVWFETSSDVCFCSILQVSQSCKRIIIVFLLN